MKVSIIVPIYNAEEYISKCIESLINQTYKNLEIILLNDGSKDNTDSIIKSYKDKRIKYIKKENTGIGNTRNLGIASSTGDYLMFVDSDDFIELNCVEELLKVVEKKSCDLVVSDYFLDTTTTYEIKFPYKASCIKDDPSLITKINLGPCNKLYKKELFNNSDSKFIENKKYEDAPFVVSMLCSAKKIGFTNTCLFHYVIKKSGETITRDKRIFDILDIVTIIESILKKYEYVDTTNLVVKILTYYIVNSRYIPDKELRNNFLDTVYNHLTNLDKNWRNVSHLKAINPLKRFLITHKSLIKIYNRFF